MAFFVHTASMLNSNWRLVKPAMKISRSVTVLDLFHNTFYHLYCFHDNFILSSAVSLFLHTIFFVVASVVQ